MMTGVADSSHLDPQVGSRERHTLKWDKSFETKAHPQWHTSTNKTITHNSSQTVPSIWDKVFEHMNLLGQFLLKPPMNNHFPLVNFLFCVLATKYHYFIMLFSFFLSSCFEVITEIWNFNYNSYWRYALFYISFSFICYFLFSIFDLCIFNYYILNVHIFCYLLD